MRPRQRAGAALARASRHGSAIARSPATASSARPARSTGRPIACYAQDGSLPRRLARRAPRRHDRPRAADGRRGRGSRSSRSSSPAARGCRRAPRRLPATAGSSARRSALTGVVPQISVVSGASAGGGAYSPALTDLILMTEDAAMFLTGPGVVREALGEEIDAAALGGPRVHDRNGVCHLVERDDPAAAARVRELLGYLPSAAGEAPPRWRSVRARARRSGRGRARRAAPRRTTSATRSRGSSTPARCSSCARAGRATSSPRWPASTAAPVGDRRQPAAPPRRRARRRGLGEGGAVRRLLRLVRAAADRGRRHARVHARLASRSRPA